MIWLLNICILTLTDLSTQNNLPLFINSSAKHTWLEARRKYNLVSCNDSKEICTFADLKSRNLPIPVWVDGFVLRSKWKFYTNSSTVEIVNSSSNCTLSKKESDVCKNESIDSMDDVEKCIDGLGTNQTQLDRNCATVKNVKGKLIIGTRSCKDSLPSICQLCYINSSLPELIVEETNKTWEEARRNCVDFNASLSDELVQLNTSLMLNSGSEYWIKYFRKEQVQWKKDLNPSNGWTPYCLTIARYQNQTRLHATSCNSTLPSLIIFKFTAVESTLNWFLLPAYIGLTVVTAMIIYLLIVMVVFSLKRCRIGEKYLETKDAIAGQLTSNFIYFKDLSDRDLASIESVSCFEQEFSTFHVEDSEINVSKTTTDKNKLPYNKSEPCLNRKPMPPPRSENTMLSSSTFRINRTAEPSEFQSDPCLNRKLLPLPESIQAGLCPCIETKYIGASKDVKPTNAFFEWAVKSSEDLTSQNNIEYLGHDPETSKFPTLHYSSTNVIKLGNLHYKTTNDLKEIGREPKDESQSQENSCNIEEMNSKQKPPIPVHKPKLNTSNSMKEPLPDQPHTKRTSFLFRLNNVLKFQVGQETKHKQTAKERTKNMRHVYSVRKSVSLSELDRDTSFQFQEEETGYMKMTSPSAEKKHQSVEVAPAYVSMTLLRSVRGMKMEDENAYAEIHDVKKY